MEWGAVRMRALERIYEFSWFIVRVCLTDSLDEGFFSSKEWIPDPDHGPGPGN